MQHGSFSRVFILAFLCSLATSILPCTASAQDYPSRPITVYCGYEAGATTDLTARGLAAGLEKLLGVAVVVENKAGGGATVAAFARGAWPVGVLAGLETVVARSQPPGRA